MKMFGRQKSSEAESAHRVGELEALLESARSRAESVLEGDLLDLAGWPTQFKTTWGDDSSSADHPTPTIVTVRAEASSLKSTISAVEAQREAGIGDVEQQIDVLSGALQALSSAIDEAQQGMGRLVLMDEDERIQAQSVEPLQAEISLLREEVRAAQALRPDGELLADLPLDAYRALASRIDEAIDAARLQAAEADNDIALAVHIALFAERALSHDFAAQATSAVLDGRVDAAGTIGELVAREAARLREHAERAHALSLLGASEKVQARRRQLSERVELVHAITGADTYRQFLSDDDLAGGGHDL